MCLSLDEGTELVKRRLEGNVFEESSTAQLAQRLAYFPLYHGPCHFIYRGISLLPVRALPV